MNFWTVEQTVETEKGKPVINAVIHHWEWNEETNEVKEVIDVREHKHVPVEAQVEMLSSTSLSSVRK